MFKKLIFLMILGLITIGVVCAEDTTKLGLNVPEGFEDVGEGVFVSYDLFKRPDQILSIVSYTEKDKEDYLKNDSEIKYTVFPYGNGVYNFVDKSMNEKGSFEIIEIDGEKFFVNFAKEGIDNENDFNDTYKFLMEFNKLNKNKNMTIINVNG